MPKQNGRSISLYMTFRDQAMLDWLATWLIPDVQYNKTPTIRKVLYERLVVEAAARGISQASVDASLDKMVEDRK